MTHRQRSRQSTKLQMHSECSIDIPKVDLIDRVIDLKTHLLIVFSIKPRYTFSTVVGQLITDMYNSPEVLSSYFSRKLPSF